MEILGIMAAIFTLLTYIPQVIKTIRTKQTRDLSLGTYILLVTSALLWVLYGLQKQLTPVWMTNAIVFTLTTTILAIKVKREHL